MSMKPISLIIKPYFFCLLLMCCFACVAHADDTDADSDSPAKHKRPVYHIDQDIDLVSTQKFQYGKPKIFVKSVIPELKSASNDFIVDHFNQLVSDLTQNEAEQFMSYVTEFASQQKKLSSSAIKNNLYTDYDASVIKSGKNLILSIRFSIQGTISGLSRPYHAHRVLNYDLDKNQAIDLSDLFLPDAQYLEALSAYTEQVLARRLQNKDFIQSGTAATMDNFKNWNIKPNGLLITFDEHQVAPEIEGTQTVLVPFSILKKFMAKDSPIIGCVKHRYQCLQSNLLTGGFIDEAINAHQADHDHSLG